MSEKTDIWMPLYIGDYLSATTHLSAEESGGYLHLLMHQWKNGSLPSEEEALRRIARIEKDAWSIAWASLKQFFDFATGVPVQLNLERIRTECDARKASSVAKARDAANKRWGKHAPSIAQAMPRTCPSSSSSSSVKSKSPTETRPPATQPDLLDSKKAREKEFNEGIDRLFAYYCRKLGRDPTRYTLTADRRKKARMRLEEREKLGDLGSAISEAKQCIDNLAESEYHRTNGYVDWTEQIFRSAEDFEKRLNWQKPLPGGPNARTTGTQRSMAAAAEYLETLRDHEGFGGTEHPSAGGSIEGNIRRLC